MRLYNHRDGIHILSISLFRVAFFLLIVSFWIGVETGYAHETEPPIAKNPLLFEMVVLVNNYSSYCVRETPEETYALLKDPRNDCGERWHKIMEFMYNETGFDP